MTDIETKIRTDAYKSKFPYPHGISDPEKRRAMHRALRDDDYRLRDEFKADLIEEFGVPEGPIHNALFLKAWDDGHSSGFREVYDHYSELAEMFYIIRDNL